MVSPKTMHVVQTLTPDRSDGRSAKPFCQGEAGAVGMSWMPMARNGALTTLTIRSRHRGQVARSLVPRKCLLSDMRSTPPSDWLWR